MSIDEAATFLFDQQMLIQLKSSKTDRQILVNTDQVRWISRTEGTANSGAFTTVHFGKVDDNAERLTVVETLEEIKTIMTTQAVTMRR